MRVTTSRWWWAVTLAGLSVLQLLALAWFGPRRGLQFRDVQELKTWADVRGLHCRSDWKDGRVTDGLAVSVRPLTWEQVMRLFPKGAPGKGPNWEGVIWAINCSADLEALAEPPYGECRVWGGILVSGDRRLLDRLESEEQ
jgi:hypothetical protein